MTSEIEFENLYAMMTARPPKPRPKRAPEETNRRLRLLLARIARAQMEDLVVPLPHAEPFHRSTKKMVIVDGSNQSSKTFHAAVEAKRAVTGTDPYDKYPKTNGLALFVGLDGDHLADPMFKKLFREGEYKIIRDEVTGLWRSVRPDPNDPSHLDPYDLAYKEQWRDAPPLIPPRMIERFAWEDKAKQIPRVTLLRNGWRILWRSSQGDPPQGVQAHLVWADEEIDQASLWINELIPRLVRYGGRLIWSATPQNGGPVLYELREKADQGSAYLDRFTFLIDQNPFMSDSERLAFRELLTTEEEVAVRYYGQYAIIGRRIYPAYEPNGIHGCEPFEIPESWTRFVGLDPGRQHCGTLFMAVDPDEQHCYVYDGFDLQSADAQKWAVEVARRQGDRHFEAFVIDQQMGKQHPPGFGLNVAEQYAAALEGVDVKPRLSGPLAGFFPGSNDIPAREEALLAMMHVRISGPFDGTPKLKVMRGVLPKLDRQIKLAHMDARNPTKRVKQEEDLLVVLEYLAAFRPYYHETVAVVRGMDTTVYDNFARTKRKAKRQPVPGLELG